MGGIAMPGLGMATGSDKGEGRAEPAAGTAKSSKRMLRPGARA